MVGWAGAVRSRVLTREPGRASGRLGYVPALDGLRGLAVLLVISHHVRTPALRGSGQTGVGLFFALSGFLITSLLLGERARTGRIDLKAFYARRAARLLPALLLMLAIVVPVSLRFPHHGDTPAQALAALFYVANWARFVGLVHGKVLGHCWSLSVEEHFYLVWPILLILAMRAGGRRRAAQVALALTGTAVVLRLALLAHGSRLIRVEYGSDTRMDALLIGCLAALVLDGRRPRLRRGAGYLGWATLLVLLKVDARGHLALTVGVTVLAIAGTLVVLDAVEGRSLAARALRWEPLVMVGRVSYGLYLWHVPVAVLLHGHLHQPHWLRDVIVVGVTMEMALFSYFVVERPVLEWKRRRLDRAGTPRRLPLRAATATAGGQVAEASA